MKTLAEILFDAIQADADIMEIVDGHITTTCFEVPPDQKDNTETPNIIVINEGFHQNASNKDYVWESPEDVVQASVDIAANSTEEVEQLVSMVRKAIESHILQMYNQGLDIPQLQPGYPQASQLQWDWMKPCYYQVVTYQCTVNNQEDDEQENS